MNKTLKLGGVTALLVSSLVLCESALAINLTIGNTISNTTVNGLTDVGQSFKNDPAGSGATILLNDWTFAFSNLPIATVALGYTLSIYSGIGKNGAPIASSNITALGTLGGFSSVQWAFNSGVSLIDNLDYTAVIDNDSVSLRVTGTNAYASGQLTVGVTTLGLDSVFEGNFSAAPVPFEFEASGGLAMLGAGWLLRKRFQKKTDKNQT